MSDVLALEEIVPGRLDEVGGKAAGLAGLIAAGFPVPRGFCVTTAAHGRGDLDRQALAAALARLGDGPVAVRSSARAEDLPDASFAGQQDTLLGVRGIDAVTAAISQIRASLHTDRAIAYRRAHGMVGEPAMAVVVQRMVEPRAAGVLFTADPITQTRGVVAIDAVPGLGTGVVDGAMASEHHTLDRQDTLTGPEDGCLSRAEALRLARVGRQVEEVFGLPQDIEWAFDREGELWLLQSRPITSLFPLVDDADDGARAFMEVGHLQGMNGPATPMGQSVLQQTMREWCEHVGLGGPGASTWLTYIGQRMYIDLTPYLRSAAARSRLQSSLDVYGPRIKRAVVHLLGDPRFAPRRRLPTDAGTLARLALRTTPKLLAHSVAALIDPPHARERAFAAAAAVREGPTLAADADPSTRLRLVSRLQQPYVRAVDPQLGCLYASLIARGIAAALLRGVATPDEINQTQRGMPHNVTVDMDLALWRVAERARPHAHLRDAPPGEFSRLYGAGELPDIGLDAFLERYGHRAACEIDIGVPRWHEDPSAVFAALAGYLRVDDPDAAPERRYAQAAREAQNTLRRLSARAIARRPLRGRLATFLLVRNRELGGLRELPKFTWLYPLDRVRSELLRVGAQLVERGLLARAEDIMMLTWPEAEQAAAGADLRDVAARRRSDHERELRRRHVPALLLSDGTDVEATLPALLEDGVLSGLAAAPGVAIGRVRVVRDPRTAQVSPGEILVTATTDPGWTPLFLTAAGLVTETGSPMAHGPTVAREYGIPAVICLKDATTRLTTGDLIEVDGSAGTVRVVGSAQVEAVGRHA